MFWKLYFITLPIFFAVDMAWLGLIAKNFYAKYIGMLMKPNVNWPAAVIFYLLFVVGLVTFVLEPSIQKQSWLNALVLGALFGMISYATYDLTNLATLKNWPLIVTIVDIAWGATLGAVVSVLSYFVFTKI